MLGSKLHDHGATIKRVLSPSMLGRLADLPFPKDVGRKLIAKKKASFHQFIPQFGWISYYFNEHGVPGVIQLFRMQYEPMTGCGRMAISIGALSGQTG